MVEENSQKSKLDRDQLYEMIIRCSDARNMDKWNTWRESHPNADIDLEAVDLKGKYLKGANLRKANLYNAKLNSAMLQGANFIEADLEEANLEQARLRKAKLHKVKLSNARLQGANFKQAELQYANLIGANLQEAKFHNALLQGAKLIGAELKQAKLHGAHLEKSNFEGARLAGAVFREAYLEGAEFCYVLVDGETHLVKCSFDATTDFTGTSLDNASIDPALKVALKDNIRRIHWQKWINSELEKGCRNRIVAWLVKWFWFVSDYGSSTKRIIKTFFWLAFGFGIFYWLLSYTPALFFPEWDGIIDDLKQGEGWIGFIQTFFRSLYFSIVTMTTLGFGDMNAAKYGFFASLLGDIFLSVQVILGYILLGALVIRLSILFTSEAPAAKPTLLKRRIKIND